MARVPPSFDAEAHRVPLRDLAGVSPPLAARNLGYLGLVWLTAVAAVAGFWWVSPSPLGFVVSFVVVSARHQALLNIEHECIHGTFVRGRLANTVIGSLLCAAPCASPYTLSRHRHLTHHRTLTDPRDPDHELHAGRSTSSRRALRRHFVTGLLGGYALMTVFRRSDTPARGPVAPRRDFAMIGVVQLLLWLATAAATSWWVYPALWLVPLATLTALCHLVRSLVEHALAPDEQARHGDRLITIVSNPLERFLVAPYFMNYHAEHHLHPWVPAPRLPQVRARLVARSGVLVRGSYLRALRDLDRALGA